MKKIFRKAKRHYAGLRFGKKAALVGLLIVLVVLAATNFSLRTKQARSAGTSLLIIYGHVDASGNILDGSGNFTVAHSSGSGTYNVTFTASPGFSSTPSVVAMSAYPGASPALTVDPPTSSGVRLRFGNWNWSQGDNGFSFIAMGLSSAPSTNVNILFGSFSMGSSDPGVMIDRGSGGWSSYYGGGNLYDLSFAPGEFSGTPTVVVSSGINSPVSCVSYASYSPNGAAFLTLHPYCENVVYNGSEPYNFIAVGTVASGATAPTNLNIAQGSWTRAGSLGSITVALGSTGIASVVNGGGSGAPAGYTVNFSSGFFAAAPLVLTNASNPILPPYFCASAYLPTTASAYIRFTGNNGDGALCTYGDDRGGYYDHTLLGATMIAIEHVPITPVLASCTAVNTAVPYGTAAQFNGGATGGTPPYSYKWTNPPSLASCGNSASCVTNALTSSFGAGTFILMVTDSVGSVSNEAWCPGIDVAAPSGVAASFSPTAALPSYSLTIQPNTTGSATIYVRNTGAAGSVMDWLCDLDPAYKPPSGLVIDTSTCEGFGLRGGAPGF